MSNQVNVGEAIARVLEAHGVGSVYGVISIHNLPIADAIGRRERIRFVAARGEAGAVTMADAHGRFSGLGVAITSTGAGAGNGVGGLLEALNAGSPLLHLTGQVEREYLDRDASFIHETRDQLTFLKASSKAAFRINSPEQAVGVLLDAIRIATTVPMGPVSVEIPIDVQAAQITLPAELGPIAPLQLPAPAAPDLAKLVAALKTARQPLLWVGGGALACHEEVLALADLGVAVISSTHGRGILSDEHPRSLGAFHNAAAVEALMAQCDLAIVVGSRLRSNETRTYSLALPRPLYQVDAHPGAASRNYASDHFVCGDAKVVLAALRDSLQGETKVNRAFDQAISEAKGSAIAALTEQLGPYATLCGQLRQALPQDAILVRDITMSGSTWGSRLFPIWAPNTNIHSLAGAIGMGLSMAIGTAIANPTRKVVGLVGDGGLMLGVGELATMVQEQTNLVLLVMNDGGYGVMRGIQNHYFGGRQYFNQLHTPDFRALGQSIGLASWQVSDLAGFEQAIAQACALKGPALIEVKMQGIGPLNFAGPPQKKLY
ncbi:thiamine pyrophosphate-binding protein [Aeromonas veronii]|uniref:thiamine pyrophosphate-binding protein n=1 Tax=Aeromonas TaxID=642 RepID=UPI001C20FDEC|nr:MULTISPECIES: thiamine pyrophosphate-binding protein [Aeromonas]MCF5766128.1 thiamine pyrophosphate-binding protein [Aeromonas veronii]QXB28111.1 thiamine pyrophosphate-binding protein [Aeromonas sp. FDAARGOS 1405]